MNAAWGAGGLVAVPALVSAAAWVFYVVGNGIVPGAVALGTVPLLLLAVPVTLVRPRVGWGVVVVLAADAGFVWHRIRDVDPGGPIPYCVDGDCGASPPLLAALIREDESAAAGIALSAGMGALRPGELDTVRSAAPAKYTRLATLRGGRPGVNALLLSSPGGPVQNVRSMPPGDGKVPALVFLHGYGGLLTAYVATLREAEALDGWAIVAPAYGFSGEWWTPRGEAIVARTLDTLPARIDRDRVVLVGLSNGAVGATRIATLDGLAERFRAVVAIEGAAEARWVGKPQRPLLVIGARNDARFSYTGLERAVASLRAAGGDVTLVPVEGDHMAFFTHTREVTDMLAGFVRPY